MKVTTNGQTIFTGPVAAFEAQRAEILASLGVDEVDIAITLTEAETKEMVRAHIAAQAGDTLSLLGTASDGAQLLLYHVATLVKGLSTANSLAEVRDATDAFAPLADAFLTKVAAGEVKLPFQLKGEAAVMTEIETRATAVSDALIQAQKG